METTSPRLESPLSTSHDSYTSRSNSSSPPPFTPCESIPEVTDVAIIGAGPTGLTLACELARRGINFVIFDINPHPISQSRALLLQSRTMEILADHGLMRTALKAGNIVRGLQVSLNNHSAFDLKFHSIDSPFPFSLVLEQSITERLLIDRLAELGHRVRRPAAVWKVEVPTTAKDDILTDFALCAAKHDASMLFAGHSLHLAAADSGMSTSFTTGPRNSSAIDAFKESPDASCTVYVKILNSEGNPIDSPVNKMRCTYVVGCDGARSCVRLATEINYLPYGSRSEFLVGDIVAIWSREFSVDRIHLLQNACGVLMILPLTHGRWRFLCTRRAASSTESSEPVLRLTPPSAQELRTIIEALVPGSVVEEVEWTSAFAVCTRIAECFRKSSALLAGDAAHMHTPTFGQGMNTGIQDAYNLGWKLAAVVRGANPRLLDTYDEERREVALEISRLSSNVFDTIIKSGPAARCVLSALSPVIAGIDFFAKSFGRILSQTELAYTKSQLVSTSFLSNKGISPGKRIPDATLVVLPTMGEGIQTIEDNPRGLVHFIRGGHHTLLLMIHVLPPGTKARTVFGCERNEEAIRWKVSCLEKLSRLARLLIEAFKGRESEVSWGGLRVVWILCGLVDFKSPRNTVSLSQVKDHVPHRLKFYLLHGSKIGGKQFIAVDYEGEVHSKLGLRLSDPDGISGADNSGAFVLVRPDGHVSCNGYAGDTRAISTAFDVALTWFTD